MAIHIVNHAPDLPDAAPARADDPRRPALVHRPSRPPRPPRPRPTTRLSAAELSLNEQAIEVFVKVVGGREKLFATLAVGTGHAHADQVLHTLLDPQYVGWSLRRVCAHVGLTVADLFAYYKRALFVQADLEATHHIVSQLLPVVRDVMQRAQPYPVECPRCQGRPNPPDTLPCSRCQGKGTIETAPDLQRQKLALELGHLIERKGNSLIVQQNAIAAAASATVTQTTTVQTGSLEQLQQVVGDLLFSPARRRAAAPSIDVTVLPTAPEDSPATPRDPPAAEEAAEEADAP